MPFNLLLFPLVGGYYFLMRCKLFRYVHQRAERQKLLFNSVIAGVFLLIISLGITWTIKQIPPIAEQFRKVLPHNVAYFGTTILSFFLGIILAEVSNRFINKETALRIAIRTIGNEFERLLESSERNEELIQITLKNDKFYIGWVKTLPVPQDTNYISITPAFSGYRDKETKRLHFTAQYMQVYDTYIENGEAEDIHGLTNLVIKVDDILTAGKFDLDMYERFLFLNNRPAQEKPAQEEPQA